MTRLLCIVVLLACSTASAAVEVQTDAARTTASWPVDGGATARLVLRHGEPDRPLIAEIAIAEAPVLVDVDPALVLTVGTRNLSEKAGWIAFFDNPPKRPYKAYRATIERKPPRVTENAGRTTLVIADLAAGPFKGDLRITIYPNSRLVQMEAVISTQQDACAILYDVGLVSDKPTWKAVAWMDNVSDDWRRAEPSVDARDIAVRNRAVIAESAGGSVAVFPAPHQYLYPLDFADNFRFAWHGRGWRGLVAESGFGVRQTIEGDNRYVPWVNAPPGTEQRLGVFLLPAAGDAGKALDDVRRFTRNDRLKKLPGHVTFSSHYHVEHTLDLDGRKTDQLPPDLVEPGFAKAFKAHGIDIVHLAEFHVHHTDDMNARRLQLLKLMHDECERLSDAKFLLLPGEEPNVHLGGHWISFFPKPVYWTLMRGKDQPFVEQVPGYGKVYHVGSAADVLKLMEQERGLMWTAHPRIKGSFGFPDAYRKTDYYKSDRFLGAAWKAMPADYSRPRLGERVLDLLDDMNNWGERKHIVGEVDVFKVNPDYELYGHLNVNYLKLDRIPRFSEGWQPVLDALRAGDFFVTTGEVLIPSFEMKPTEVRATVEWTFPLAFAEVISGDGEKIFRDRFELSDTESFGRRELILPVNLAGRTWARLEVWDIAANGAFTQPR